MTVFPIQSSFGRGVLSPRLHARVDIDHYKIALADSLNFYILRQGGLRRRPGTRFAALAKTATGNVIFLPFIFSPTQSYAIELGNLYARFFTLGGPVMSGMSPYEIVTPWPENHLQELQFEQEGDVIYVTHPAHTPAKLQRFSETNWTITNTDIKDGPYLTIISDGTTLAPDITGNIIPLMTSNTAPSGVASASGETTGRSPWLAFDGQTNTDWQAFDSSFLTLPDYVYLRYQFAVAKICGGYYIQSSVRIENYTLNSNVFQVPGHLRAPRTWTLEGSNNGTDWTLLDSRSGVTDWGDGERRYFPFKNKTAYTYYQLAITDTNQSANAPRPVSIASFALSGAETDRTTIRLTASSLASINKGAGFGANDVGRHVRYLNEDAVWHWFRITAIVSTTVVDAELYSPPLPNTKAALSWRLGAFSNSSGWPARVALFQERVIYGRTDFSPRTINGSKTDDFDNFGVSIPLKADDALSLTLNEKGEIQWLLDNGDLIVATMSSIRPVGPADKTQGFSATNFQQGRPSRTGAAAIQPAPAGDAHIFVGQFRNSLHELAQSPDINGYATPDVSILSEHLYKPKIKHICFAKKPNALLWSGMDDGSLVGMTYERDQKMVAHAPHALGGAGQVIAQCVVPGPVRDELWLIVQRGSLRTVEFMEADFERGNPSDAFYVDCGLTATSGTPFTTVSGLGHLEGLEVAVLADGAVEPRKTVTGGSITLSGPASIAHVGLPYTSRAKTLRLAQGGGDGSGLGRKKTVNRVILDIYETSGLRVKAAGDWQDVNLRSTDDLMDTAVPLMTGAFGVLIDDRWEHEGVVEVEVSDPLPCTIRAITPAYDGEP